MHGYIYWSIFSVWSRIYFFQMGNLSKEEFVRLLRRRSIGFPRGSKRFRGNMTLHKYGRWDPLGIEHLFNGNTYEPYIANISWNLTFAIHMLIEILRSHCRERTPMTHFQLTFIRKNLASKWIMPRISCSGDW